MRFKRHQPASMDRHIARQAEVSWNRRMLIVTCWETLFHLLLLMSVLGCMAFIVGPNKVLEMLTALPLMGLIVMFSRSKP